MNTQILALQEGNLNVWFWLFWYHTTYWHSTKVRLMSLTANSCVCPQVARVIWTVWVVTWLTYIKYVLSLISCEWIYDERRPPPTRAHAFCLLVKNRYFRIDREKSPSTRIQWVDIIYEWAFLFLISFYDIFMKHFYKYNIYVDLELSQAMYKHKNARSEIVLSHCDESLNKPTCPMVVKPLPTSRGHQISSCALKCYNWQRT